MNYFDVCNKYRGKVVRITDRNSRVHVGRITRVTKKHVWIQPVGNRGYGYWGWGYGGYGYPIGLGFITGFALGALFF